MPKIFFIELKKMPKILPRFLKNTHPKNYFINNNQSQTEILKMPKPRNNSAV